MDVLDLECRDWMQGILVNDYQTTSNLCHSFSLVFFSKHWLIRYALLFSIFFAVNLMESNSEGMERS